MKRLLFGVAILLACCSRSLPKREDQAEDTSAVLWTASITLLGPRLYLVKTPAGCIYVLTDRDGSSIASTECPR